MSFIERHKPILTIMAAIILLALVGAAFLFLHDHEEEEDLTECNKAVEQTLTSFSDALMDGNIKKAKKYCSETGAQQLVLDSLDTEVYEKTLLEGLSVKKEDLPEDSRAYLDSLLDILKGKVVTETAFDISKMEVQQKTEDGYIVSIPMQLTGCGSLNAIDFSSEISFANHSMINYAYGNQELLMNHNDVWGTAGVKSVLGQQAYSNLFSTMCTKATAYEPVARNYELKLLVTKKDGDFSSAQIIAAEEVLSE